jgi:hypothetical protein
MTAIRIGGPMGAAIDMDKGGLRQIEDAVAQIQVQGDRYPAPLAARAGK